MNTDKDKIELQEEVVVFSNETYAIVEKSRQDVSGLHSQFTRYVPSSGQFVLVLPFKRVKNHYQYLLERAWVPGWDNHPDLCALTAPSSNEPQNDVQALLKDFTGIEFNVQSFVPLGVVAASRWSGDSFYLFAIDITAIQGEVGDSRLAWVDENTLVQALDAQVVVAMARLKLVP